MAYAYAIERDMIHGDSFGSYRPTRCRPKRGACLLLFIRKQEEILFTAQGVVTEAPEPGREEHVSKYTIGDIESLVKPRSLVELAGSLQHTRHFLEPWEGFRGWLIAMSKQDFETVVADEPAMARSIFRMLFHALPLSIQASFVQQHANLFPGGRRVSFRYERLAEALIDYLECTLGECRTLFEEFISTYPDEIEGIPQLNELWLMSGDAETKTRKKAIQFGVDVQDLHKILGRFSLAETDEGFALFRECRKWLEYARDREWRRQWTDQIF